MDIDNEHLSNDSNNHSTGETLNISTELPRQSSESVSHFADGANSSAEVDALGTPYDPAIHSPSKKKKKNGEWKLKVGRAAPGSKEEKHEQKQIEALAGGYVNMYEGFSVAIYKEHGTFNAELKAMLNNSVSRLLNHYDMPDLHPIPDTLIATYVTGQEVALRETNREKTSAFFKKIFKRKNKEANVNAT